MASTGEDNEEGDAASSGGDDDDAPALPWETDDPLFDAELVRAQAWCDCYGDSLDYEGTECVDSLGPRTTAACERDVLYSEVDAVPRLTCLIEANEAEAECFADQGCPAEQGAVCKQQAFDAEQACPDYSDAVVAALNACIEPEPFWLVGDEGMIFGIDPEGNARPDEQATTSDFEAIVCDGAADAWIVGDQGTVLRTADAGASWRVTTVGTSATLRAVAQEGGVNVMVAGDDGAVFRSADGGERWDAVHGPHRDWRGVTAARAGGWLFASAQGEIWALPAGGSFHEVLGGESPLYDIDGHHHGLDVAAVGAGGVLVTSSDGGDTWVSVTTPTSSDLYSVDVVDRDHGIVAAGEGGVILRADASGAWVVADDGPAVFDLHVTSDGSGAAVGEAGRFLLTRDGGDTWFARDLGIEADLRGLDQPFHAH